MTLEVQRVPTVVMSARVVTTLRQSAATIKFRINNFQYPHRILALQKSNRSNCTYSNIRVPIDNHLNMPNWK